MKTYYKKKFLFKLGGSFWEQFEVAFPYKICVHFAKIFQLDLQSWAKYLE